MIVTMLMTAYLITGFVLSMCIALGSYTDKISNLDWFLWIFIWPVMCFVWRRKG